ncbi:MAG: hypothetical protein WBD59_12850 [Candidatus Sulfotelmatobacter sp.]
MTDNNLWQGESKQQVRDHDPLDRELDAALAKYAAVEPRAGIEQRILASLRAEQKQSSVRPWWGWPAIGGLSVAVVVAALVLAFEFWNPAPSLTAHQSPTATLSAAGKTIASVGNLRGAASRATELGTVSEQRRPRGAHLHSREDENAGGPKLDVFPSPQPLSEQEKMLVAYVAQHSQQAALIARARTEELKEDLAIEAAEQNTSPDPRPSDQSVNQQNMNQQEHESAGDR